MFADLHLQHFRSYTDESFEFSPGVNIFVGPNAIGKTNLLEAILVLARGHSYRVKDEDLVQYNKEWSKVEARLEQNTTRVVKITPLKTTKITYEINNKQLRRLS